MLQPDQALENYTIMLVKGEPISGVVRGDDGKTVANAFVAVTKQANPTMRGPATPADGGAASDGTVEAQMSDRTDEQGRFTVENVPPGTTYSVLVWFAQGYKGFSSGDEAAIKRGVSPGAHDVDLVLKKAEAGDMGFPRPPMPRPSTGGVPAGGPAMGGTSGMGGG